MSSWPSVKARKLMAALLKIGWSVKRHTSGSHRVLYRDGWPTSPGAELNLSHVMVNFVLSLMLLMTALLASCKDRASQSSPPIAWRNDKPPIERRIPLLTPFEQCLWFGGQATNHSGRGLPAPEEYFIEGFIVVSEEAMVNLQEQFEWSSITLDVATIDRPTTPSMADSFFNGPKFLESKQFMREHTKQSSFSDGQIVLNPDELIVYFYLKNL